MDQKNDPDLVRSRIDPMLNGSQSMFFDDARAPPATRKQSMKVKSLPDDISQQTSWMLAVRDRRDREAFGLLFDYFAPRLKGFFMRSGTSSGQAEEIVQDVMLSVWRMSGSYDPHRGQVSAWIYRIARNRQIDVIRRETRPVPEELREDPGMEPDAGQILAVEQEAGYLQEALTRLKPDQRLIIEKAYLGELSHQEISRQTGLPLGTIKSRIRLGLERLKHELKGLR